MYDREHENDGQDEEFTSTSVCEWDGCEEVFTGPNGPSLLYVSPYLPLYNLSETLTGLQHHIVETHIDKPGATQT